MTTRTFGDAAAAGQQRSSRMRAMLFVLAGNMLIDALEVSVIVVALPSIASDLRLPPSSWPWLMSGFAVGFGGLLLFGDRVVARFGRRRVYLAALLVFIGAALVGGVAGSTVLLVVSRFVKGLCAALTAPVGLSIITSTFKEGSARNWAVSVYALFGAAGFSVGLFVAGLLADVSWRWTFVFPAPFVLVLFCFGWKLIPRDRPAGHGREDRARTSKLRLLADLRLARSAFGAATFNGSYLALLFLSTFQLQWLLGWSSFQTGLAFLPASVPLVFSALFSGRLIERFGTAWLIAAGATAALAGNALYLWTGVPARYATGVLPTLLLTALGFVLCFTALNVQAMSTVTGSERGTAAAVYQAAVQLGAAGAPAIAYALVLMHQAPGRPASEVIVAGSRPALVFITALSAAGLAAALLGLLHDKRRQVGS